ncbi:MAG: RNA polymerase sigma factor SigY [Ignavibacteriales bacterium]
MNEKTLIDLCKNGNREALERIISDNYPIVKGYLIKITLNEHLAEDLTQDCFIRALDNIKKYSPNGKLSTWLITIANNLYYDYLRKNRKIVLGLEMEEDIQSVEENFEDRLELKEIANVISLLPYEKRTAFILKHYYGYKYEEIAQILKCPIGTVKSRIFSAIELIQKKLEGDETDEK